jgi:hypothetical protein
MMDETTVAELVKNTTEVCYRTTQHLEEKGGINEMGFMYGFGVYKHTQEVHATMKTRGGTTRRSRNRIIMIKRLNVR